MAKGDREEKVRQLMTKGFSKAKCTQALKDAGNNASLALQLLERQRQSEGSTAAGPSRAHPATRDTNDQYADPQALLTSSPTESPSEQASVKPSLAASIPSLKRPPKPSANAAFAQTASQQQLQRQRQRRHPCIVQYGTCQYGDYCLLKDFPGDVCVQYFQGCCIYGAGCRHRHTVDGVDVREVWNAAAVPEEGDWQDDLNVVRTGESHDASGSAGLHDRHDYHPGHHQSDYGAVGENSSNQVDYTAFQEGEDAVPHPTPFLDLARAAGTRSSGSATVSVTRGVSATLGGRSGGAAGRRRHPCVAQFGRCKYGDACLHADRDADVCVHFLNGRCRFSADECRYRHESDEEYQQTLRVRAGLNVNTISDTPSAANRNNNKGNAADVGRSGDNKTVDGGVASSPPPRTHSPRRKNRLQGGSVASGGGRISAATGNHSNPLRSPRPHSGASARSSSHYSAGGADALGHGASSPVPALTHTNTNTTSTSRASPLPSFEDLNALTAALSHVNSAHDVAELASGEVETHVFLNLLDAFPQVEPAVALQTLRLCGGDLIETSDALSRYGAAPTAAEAEDFAAALALAAAEDADEREMAAAAARDAAANARHNALLTLLMLFPTVDVAEAEAVLTRAKGDFASAYNVLLCAQEKMARAALWKGSSAKLSPADQLRVEKLYAMFPGLHQEIVRSAFCAADSDWSSATAALNELTKELLSLEAVELPARPVVWHPARGAANAFTSAASATATAAALTAEETSDEAYAAYRAAEKEILSFGDWRQVREQAYLINTQRIRVLSQASAAFHNGDGQMAKLLSREGHRMAVEYNRLNRMAMLALEHERLRTEATSTLDLHGFHTAEVHDVVVRRVEVCQKKRVGQLRIVVGEGLHSKRGHGSLYTTLSEELRTDPFLKANTKVKSVKAGYLDVAVRLPTREA